MQLFIYRGIPTEQGLKRNLDIRVMAGTVIYRGIPTEQGLKPGKHNLDAILHIIYRGIPTEQGLKPSRWVVGTARLAVKSTEVFQQNKDWNHIIRLGDGLVNRESTEVFQQNKDWNGISVSVSRSSRASTEVFQQNKDWNYRPWVS